MSLDPPVFNLLADIFGVSQIVYSLFNPLPGLWSHAPRTADDIGNRLYGNISIACHILDRRTTLHIFTLQKPIPLRAFAGTLPCRSSENKST